MGVKIFENKLFADQSKSDIVSTRGALSIVSCFEGVALGRVTEKMSEEVRQRIIPISDRGFSVTSLK
jgi:hypothetical protein